MTDIQQGAPSRFVLGIVGDSGSGKSTITSGVRRLLGPDRVATLELDDYLLLTRAERAQRGVTALHPSVHDFQRIDHHLRRLRMGDAVENPMYDHTDGTFGPPRRVEPRDTILVRGLFGFPTDEIRALYDLAVFLQPEPELGVRWKLRRDVGERGYTQAEGLKRIAQHLLDSKEFVLPQAERADLVVRSTLPHPNAPDDDVRTEFVLRRRAADAIRGHLALRRFGSHLHAEERGEELVIHLAETLTLDEAETWARTCFPDAVEPESLGVHRDDAGGEMRRTALLFTQVLVATLARQLQGAAMPTG